MTASSLKRKRGLEMNKKVSSSKMATNASAILKASGSSKIQKSLAASVLSQSVDVYKRQEYNSVSFWHYNIIKYSCPMSQQKIIM